MSLVANPGFFIFVVLELMFYCLKLVYWFAFCNGSTLIFKKNIKIYIKNIENILNALSLVAMSNPSDLGYLESGGHARPMRFGSGGQVTWVWQQCQPQV